MTDSTLNSSLESHSADAWAQRRAELLAALSATHPELVRDNQLDLQKLQACGL